MAVREIILTAQHSTAQHSTAQHSSQAYYHQGAGNRDFQGYVSIR